MKYKENYNRLDRKNGEYVLRHVRPNSLKVLCRGNEHIIEDYLFKNDAKIHSFGDHISTIEQFFKWRRYMPI